MKRVSTPDFLMDIKLVSVCVLGSARNSWKYAVIFIHAAEHAMN